MPSNFKSMRQVKKAFKALDKIDADWRRYEVKMNKLAPKIKADGEPIDLFLLRLYNAAKEMDKPLVELANA